MRIVLRILINAAALWAAATLLDGITLSSRLLDVIGVAVVFGLINAFIKPVAKLLTLPLTILTLGLFTLVINAGMLGLAARLTGGLEVNGFFTAVGGSIIISIVSWALSVLLPDGD
ncbi:MAG: phage holin family protein [Acidimicrobiales bacterium]